MDVELDWHDGKRGFHGCFSNCHACIDVSSMHMMGGETVAVGTQANTTGTQLETWAMSTHDLTAIYALGLSSHDQARPCQICFMHNPGSLFKSERVCYSVLHSLPKVKSMSC